MSGAFLNMFFKTPVMKEEAEEPPGGGSGAGEGEGFRQEMWEMRGRRGQAGEGGGRQGKGTARKKATQVSTAALLVTQGGDGMLCISRISRDYSVHTCVRGLPDPLGKIPGGMEPFSSIPRVTPSVTNTEPTCKLAEHECTQGPRPGHRR